MTDGPLRLGWLAAALGVVAVVACAPEPPPATRWAWSGGIESDWASVVAKADTTDGRALRVGLTADLHDATVYDPVRTYGTVLRFAVDELEPSTRYYYALENDGTVAATIQTFRTFPDGPADLKLAFGSCSDTGSTSGIFDTIRQLDPDLFLVAGDLHYQDIAVNDITRFRRAYDQVFGSPTRAELHENVPTAYVWDDHDYGPNDSDSSAKGRSAAQQAYREIVPHYPLAQDVGPIQQAFSYGRIRIIMTDTRSMRDRAKGTMLGDQQREWLIEELTRAHETHALVLWVSSVAWISSSSEKDSWGGFPNERSKIASAIVERGLDRIIMLSGDAHMVGIDDGRNNRYGGARSGFPVFHAAPLDRPGSKKGGPYSEGTIAKRGQFGVVEVTDDGGPLVRVLLTGRDKGGRTIMRYAAEVAVPTLEGS